MAVKNYPTKEELHQIFEYRDGELYWKVAPSNRVKVGAMAGCISHGYKKVGAFGNEYPLHKLVFIMHHGYAPEMLDHADCNPLNNRIENLRPANYFQNNINVGLKKSNTSGYKNVHWDKSRQKWMVFFRVNGKRLQIGRYDDKEKAIQVAKETREKLHKEFANHG